MKNNHFCSCRRQTAAWGSLLGLGLLLSASAYGQNLLKNGDFESQMPGSDPKSNWTVVYVDSGPDDFAIATQTTEASRAGGGRGAHLRANSPAFAHAYFKQVVTGLKPGARYTLKGLRMEGANPQYLPERMNVYMAAISGSVSNAVSATGGNSGPYSLAITAAPSGQIEVQLHMSKRRMVNEGPEDMKHAKCAAWFDDFSLTLTP